MCRSRSWRPTRLRRAHKVDAVPQLFGRSLTLPQDDALATAAEVLNAGSRIAILAGQGALGAAQELEQVADILGAPVAKALLGKAVLADAHPHVTGGVGYLGARPSQQVLAGCDTPA